MGAGHDHTHLLFVHGDSRVHQLKPECKVAAAGVFILAVVATPREAVWAFGVHALCLALAASVAKVGPRLLLRRLRFELPFVAFALFLPIFAPGERIPLAGASVSAEGLWAGWNIVVKGTLGVAASAILAASTPVAELLRGLERLGLPRAFTSIAGFMLRYFHLLIDDVRRMRIARESRGHEPRWLWDAKAVASSAGALFIRCYERGERVYLAMVSRGFAGSMPALAERAATKSEWAAALALPSLAAVVAGAAWVVLP